MTKTMSIRMDRENFEFLNELTKEQRSDLSKAVRDMVTRGRVLFAMERYKKGEASPRMRIIYKDSRRSERRGNS